MADKKFWAALVIITIVLAILAYFSINLRNYVTGKAIINPPFSVLSWNIKASEIAIQIENNEQENYEIQSISIAGCGSYETPTNIESETKIIFIISCQQGLRAGEDFKGDITITYRKINGSVDLTSKGEISGKVR